VVLKARPALDRFTVTSQTLASFTTVRRLTRNLDGVEDTTAYGSPCLKVGGRILACIAINKAAEPNTLMVRLSSFEQRDELIAEQPDVYYLKPHYEPYPCVLVRLGRVDADALRDLLLGAWRDAKARPKAPTARPGARKRASA
jgi:hypothetical protein